MAFGKKNNNNEKDKGVNTRGIQLYNKEGFEASTIQFGYWNGNMTVRINPALPKNKRTETSVYDYDTFNSAVLSVEKAKTLLKVITEKFIPEYNKNESVSYGVAISDGMIEISNGIKFGCEKPTIALTIYDKIDGESSKCNCYMTYEFNKSIAIAGYDFESGKYDSFEVDGEFNVFIEYLANGIAALTNAYVHADRNVRRGAEERRNKSLNAIMNALSINIDDVIGGDTTSYKKTGGLGSGRGGFNSNSDKPHADNSNYSEDDMDAVERELNGTEE